MARHLSSVIRTAANNQRHNSPLLAYKVLNLHIYVKVYTGSQSSTQQQSRTATNTTKTLLHSEIATTSELEYCVPENSNEPLTLYTLHADCRISDDIHVDEEKFPV